MTKEITDFGVFVLISPINHLRLRLKLSLKKQII
jgi:hypothetical protein